MGSERLYKLDQKGQLSFANPPPSKIEALKAQGKILTYEQLNLPQRQRAKELEAATLRMLSHLDQVMAVAKKIRNDTGKEGSVSLKLVSNDAETVKPGLPVEFVFGYRLKVIRRKFGYSQQKVGELAGLNSASTVMNHYEKGRHQPTLQTTKAIAEVFGVPIAYFFAETDELAELILNHRPSTI